MREIGHEMSEEWFIANGTGTSPKQVFGKLLPTIGNPVTVEEATERKRNIYFEMIKGNMQMLPGVRNLIEDLNRKGFKQAVASGATRPEVDAVIQEFGIGHFFGAVIASEDVTHGKPHPEPFLTAASRIGVDPVNCVVMEDGEFGVRSAKSSGMKTIAVLNTQTRDDLAAADVIVESLEEIDVECVMRLISQPEFV